MGIPNPIRRLLTEKINDWFENSVGISKFEQWRQDRPERPESMWEQVEWESPVDAFQVTYGAANAGMPADVFGSYWDIAGAVGMTAALSTEAENAARSRAAHDDIFEDTTQAYLDAVQAEAPDRYILMGGQTSPHPARESMPWYLQWMYEPGGRDEYAYYDIGSGRLLTTPAAFTWNQPGGVLASFDAAKRNAVRANPEYYYMGEAAQGLIEFADDMQHTLLHEPIGPYTLYEHVAATLEAGNALHTAGIVTGEALDDRIPIIDDFKAFAGAIGGFGQTRTAALERYAEARRPENYYPQGVPPHMEYEMDLITLAAYGTRGFGDTGNPDVYYRDYADALRARESQVEPLRNLSQYYRDILQSPFPLIGDEAPLWARGYGAAPAHWPEYPDLNGYTAYEMSVPSPRSIDYTLAYQIDRQADTLAAQTGEDWLSANVNPWRQAAIMAVSDWTMAFDWGFDALGLSARMRRANQARNSLLSVEEAAEALGRNVDELVPGGGTSWWRSLVPDNTWAGGINQSTFAPNPAPWVEIEEMEAAASVAASAASPRWPAAASAAASATAPIPASVADDPFGGSWDTFWSGTLGASASGPAPASGDPVWDTSFVDPGFGVPRGPASGPDVAWSGENPFTSLLAEARANPGPFQRYQIAGLEASSAMWANPRGLEWSGEYDWDELEAIFRERFVGEGPNVMQNVVRGSDDTLIGTWFHPDANISQFDQLGQPDPSNMPMYSGMSSSGPFPESEATFAQQGTYEIFRAALTNDGWTFANEGEMRRFGEWLGTQAGPLVPDDRAYRGRAETVFTSLVRGGVDEETAARMVQARFGDTGLNFTGEARGMSWLPDDPLVGSNTDPIRVTAQSFYEPVYGPLPEPENIWLGTPQAGEWLSHAPLHGPQEYEAEVYKFNFPWNTEFSNADEEAKIGLTEDLSVLGTYGGGQEAYDDFLLMLDEYGGTMPKEFEASLSYQVARNEDQRVRLQSISRDLYGDDPANWELLPSHLTYYLPNATLPDPEMRLYRGVKNTDTWRVDDDGALVLLGQHQVMQGLHSTGVSLSTDAGVSYSFANPMSLDTGNVESNSYVMFSFPASVLQPYQDAGINIWHKGDYAEFELFPEIDELRIPPGQWTSMTHAAIKEDDPAWILYQYGLQEVSDSDLADYALALEKYQDENADYWQLLKTMGNEQATRGERERTLRFAQDPAIVHSSPFMLWEKMNADETIFGDATTLWQATERAAGVSLGTSGYSEEELLTRPIMLISEAVPAEDVEKIRAFFAQQATRPLSEQVPIAYDGSADLISQIVMHLGSSTFPDPMSPGGTTRYRDAINFRMADTFTSGKFSWGFPSVDEIEENLGDLMARWLRSPRSEPDWPEWFDPSGLPPRPIEPTHPVTSWMDFSSFGAMAAYDPSFGPGYGVDLDDLMSPGFVDQLDPEFWAKTGLDPAEYQSRLTDTQTHFSTAPLIRESGAPDWMMQGTGMQTRATPGGVGGAGIDLTPPDWTIGPNLPPQTRWVDTLTGGDHIDDLSQYLSYTPVPGASGPPDYTGRGRSGRLDSMNPFAPTDTARILGARDTWDILMGTFLAAEPDADEMRLLFEYLLDDPAALLSGVDARQFPSMAGMASAPTEAFPGGVLRFGGGLKQADLNEIRPVIAMMEDDLMSMRALGGMQAPGVPMNANAVKVESTQSFMRHAGDYYAPDMGEEEFAQWLWKESAAAQFGYAASTFLHTNFGVQTRNAANAFFTAAATGVQTLERDADLISREIARGGGTLPITRVFESVNEDAISDLVPGARGLFMRSGLQDGSFWRFNWLRDAVGELSPIPRPERSPDEQEIRRAFNQYFGDATGISVIDQMEMLHALPVVDPSLFDERELQRLEQMLTEAGEVSWRQSINPVDLGKIWNLPNPVAAVDEAGARAIWGNTTMWGTGGRVSWGEGSHFTRYYAAGTEWYLRENAPDRFGALLDDVFSTFSPMPQAMPGEMPLDEIQGFLRDQASDLILDSSRKEFNMRMQEAISAAGLPESDRRALIQTLTNDMLPLYDDLSAEARRTGMSLSRFTMLEPGETVNADNWLGPLSLFSFFPTRTALNWVERTATAPHWAHWYHLFNTAAATESENENYPDRYEGMWPLGVTDAFRVPLIGTEVGPMAWMMSNPIDMALPFNVFGGDRYNKPEDAETLGELAMSMMGQVALNPSPLAEMALAPDKFEPTALTPKIGYMVELLKAAGVAPERLEQIFGDDFEEGRISRNAGAWAVEGPMTREQALWVQDIAYQEKHGLDPLRTQPAEASDWYEQTKRITAGQIAFKDTTRLSPLGMSIYPIPVGELQAPPLTAEYDYMSAWMLDQDLPKDERDALRRDYFQRYPGVEAWYTRDDLYYNDSEDARPGRQVYDRHTRPPLPDLPGQGYPWEQEGFEWRGDVVDGWTNPATGEIDKSMSALYRLFDPRTNETMYIGQSVTPSTRFQDHLSDIDEYGDEHPKTRWMRELANADMVPGMQIIGWYPRDDRAQDWTKNAESITGQEYMMIGWMYYELGMPYDRFGNVDIPSRDEYEALMRSVGRDSMDMWDIWGGMDGQIVAPKASPDMTSPSPNSILTRGYLREDPWEHLARELKPGATVRPGGNSDMFTVIPGVGEKTSPLLYERFGSWDQLALASVEQLAEIDGIGEPTAEKIIEFANAALAWNAITPGTSTTDRVIAQRLTEQQAAAEEKAQTERAAANDALQADPYFYTATPDLRIPGTADFDAIEGIGPKILAGLDDAGFETWDDIRAATDEEIEAVAGVGPIIRERLRRAAGQEAEQTAGIPDEVAESAPDFSVYLPMMAGAVGATELPGRPSVYLPIMHGTVGATEWSSQPSGFDDFEVVSGIGPKTEQALYEAGFTTWDDITGASYAALDAVSGIGEKTINLLRAQAGAGPLDAASSQADGFDDFEIVKGIGPKTEEALYAAGFTTWEDILGASSDALNEVEGIGDKTIALLRAQAGVTDPAQSGIASSSGDPYFGAGLPDLRMPGTDDFTTVKGIGPKTTAALNAAGYYTWESILGASFDDLDEVEGLGPKTIEALYQAAVRGASGNVTDLRMLESWLADNVSGGGVRRRGAAGDAEIEPRWWEKVRDRDYRDLPHRPWVDFVNPDGTWHINQQYRDGTRWEKTGPPDPGSLPYVTGVDAQGNWIVDYDIFREYSSAERAGDAERMAAAANVATATRAASGDPRWEGDLLTGEDLEYLPGIGKVSEQKMYGYGVTSVEQLRERGVGWIDERLSLSDETRAKLLAELGLEDEAVSQARYQQEASARLERFRDGNDEGAQYVMEEMGRETGFSPPVLDYFIPRTRAGDMGSYYGGRPEIQIGSNSLRIAYHEAAHGYWDAYRQFSADSFMRDVARYAGDLTGGEDSEFLRGFFFGTTDQASIGHNEGLPYGAGYSLLSGGWDDHEVFALSAENFAGRYHELPPYLSRWFGGIDEDDAVPTVLPRFDPANLPVNRVAGPLDLSNVPPDMREHLADSDVLAETGWARAVQDIGGSGMSTMRWNSVLRDGIWLDAYTRVPNNTTASAEMTQRWFDSRVGTEHSWYAAGELSIGRSASYTRNWINHVISQTSPDLYTYGDASIRLRPSKIALQNAYVAARHGTTFDRDYFEDDLTAAQEESDRFDYLYTYGEEGFRPLPQPTPPDLGTLRLAWDAARLGRFADVADSDDRRVRQEQDRYLQSYGDDTAGTSYGASLIPEDIPGKLAREVKVTSTRPASEAAQRQADISRAVRKARAEMKEEIMRELADEVILDEELFP